MTTGPAPIGLWEYWSRGFFGVGSQPGGWPVGERWPQLQFGPGWFLEHLLIYTMLYALWRALAPKRAPDAAPPAPPSSWAIFGYAVALTIATIAIRFWYPQDRWIGFLGFWQMEPAHLPQYASMFVIGIVAGRGRWIETMPKWRGLSWLAVGIVFALFLYVAAGVGMFESRGVSTAPPATLGGLNWPDWRGCIWESFLCTSLCVGLPVAFRELALGASRLWRMLGRNVLAIYVFHFPFVLLMQWALLETDLPKWSRLLLTWPAAVILTVAFTNWVVLRLPGLRRVF